jgi:hypothetical protein
MTRGPVFVSANVFGDVQWRGGSVPIAKVLLPQFSSAEPIRLVANNENRRVAEARPRRPT